MLKILKERITRATRLLLTGNAQASRQRVIPPISEEEVIEARSAFPMVKFFIFGHARSGTTILARLIRLHPEVHCNWQAHFFTRPPTLESLVADPEVGAWLTRSSNRWNQGRDLSPVVLRATADFILERDARRVGKRVVGDKSPSSLIHGDAVRRMWKVYPDAYLINIVRDGRDTVLSHRFQAFIEWPDRLPVEDIRIRTDFAKDPRPYLCGERSIFSEKGIHQAASAWAQNVTETDLEGKRLYGEKYISLRYEDLLNKPWEEIIRIWTFLGAFTPDQQVHDLLTEEMNQNQDAEWQQQKASEIAQSLQKGKKGSWRDMFTISDRLIFHEVAGKTLSAWGYELK